MILKIQNMLNLRKYFRRNYIIHELFYRLHIDDLLVYFRLSSFEVMITKAINKFRPNINSIEEKSLRKDIRHSYYVCKSSPDEYFLMGLYNFDDAGKKKFVTDKFLYRTMGNINSRRLHDDQIENKLNFYKLAMPYFKRSVVGVFGVEDFLSFKRMAIDVGNIIIKPNNACMGKGIKAAYVGSEYDAENIFNQLMDKRGEGYVIEERIKQSEEMAVWCNTCVNTVRVLSFINSKTGFHILKPFLRTGRYGSIVDNAGAGGILANVNVKTGTLCSHGIDELGNIYISHPDSNITFEGWQIPQYNELIRVVREMHETIMPHFSYIGWDMALSTSGWCVIEANWGQFLNQYVDNIGLKPEFLDYVFGNNKNADN